MTEFMKDLCLCARVSAAEIELLSWSGVRKHGKSSCRLDESEGLDECGWRMTLTDGQMADLRKTGSCDAIDFERSDLLPRGGLCPPSPPLHSSRHQRNITNGIWSLAGTTETVVFAVFSLFLELFFFFFSLSLTRARLLFSPPFPTADKKKFSAHTLVKRLQGRGKQTET